MKICSPIKRKSAEKIIKDIIEFQKYKEINVIEIWFDELNWKKKNALLKKIFSILKKPIIYKSQGKILNIKKILNYHVDYIDLDIATPGNKIKKIKKISPKTKIIISYHDFYKTPSLKYLRKIVKKIINKQADIIKIATHANKFSDSLILMNLLNEISDKYKSIIISMGKKGAITRAAGHLLGNYLMYAPIKNRNKTAQGQLLVNKLKKIQNLIK